MNKLWATKVLCLPSDSQTGLRHKVGAENRCMQFYLFHLKDLFPGARTITPTGRIN